MSDDKPKKGFFQKMLDGLKNTKANIQQSVDNVLAVFTKIDDELFEELTDALILADIGVATAEVIISAVKKRTKLLRETEVSAIYNILAEEILVILTKDSEVYEIEPPTIILIIGVNGVGKTTTIAKLANNIRSEGKSVLIAAGDTFRAAAIEQLETWCKRINVDLIKHQAGADPASVVFDAVAAAKARKTDVLICDTAGRLHNKKNLMDELRKIYKIVSQNYSEAKCEVFLVLDATTGQNALSQAKLFSEATDITGIVLTKLDGTAKGGVVVAIKNEMEIPIRYVGVGEGVDDLQVFDAAEFAKALVQKD